MRAVEVTLTVLLRDAATVSCGGVSVIYYQDHYQVHYQKELLTGRQVEVGQKEGVRFARGVHVTTAVKEQGVRRLLQVDRGFLAVVASGIGRV